jgi:hypothetical protein
MSVMQSRREGFALAGAVLAMVLVGAIVTGGFYAAHQESQVTRSNELGDLAQYIAEQGLESVVASTNANTLNALAISGGPDTLASAVAVQYGGKTVGNYTVTINRLTNFLFTVSSTGTVTIGQAGNNSNSQRTVSSVVRIRQVDMDNQAAIQVFGDLTVGGTSDVVGNTDTSHGAWSGCTSQTGTSAVLTQNGTQINTQGAGNIQGPITRTTLNAGNFTVFGDLTWNDLVSMATNVYGTSANPSPAATTTGSGASLACDKTNINNWGAPTSNGHVCFNHFPIIYAPGDMDISANSTGQGILLVAGDLRVQSQFEFYGPIIVMGTIDFQGGADLMGSIMAYGGGNINSNSTTAGNMSVSYSSCAISRAVNGASGLVRSVPIRNRSWMDLTAIQNSF